MSVCFLFRRSTFLLVLSFIPTCASIQLAWWVFTGSLRCLVLFPWLPPPKCLVRASLPGKLDNGDVFVVWRGNVKTQFPGVYARSLFDHISSKWVSVNFTGSLACSPEHLLLYTDSISSGDLKLPFPQGESKPVRSLFPPLDLSINLNCSYVGSSESFQNV